jgi:hypothetical protein
VEYYKQGSDMMHFLVFEGHSGCSVANRCKGQRGHRGGTRPIRGWWKCLGQKRGLSVGVAIETGREAGSPPSCFPTTPLYSQAAQGHSGEDALLQQRHLGHPYMALHPYTAMKGSSSPQAMTTVSQEANSSDSHVNFQAALIMLLPGA